MWTKKQTLRKAHIYKLASVSTTARLSSGKNRPLLNTLLGGNTTSNDGSSCFSLIIIYTNVTTHTSTLSHSTASLNSSTLRRQFTHFNKGVHVFKARTQLRFVLVVWVWIVVFEATVCGIVTLGGRSHRLVCYYCVHVSRRKQPSFPQCFSSELHGVRPAGERATPVGLEWKHKHGLCFLFCNVLRSFWEYCDTIMSEMLVVVFFVSPERAAKIYLLFYIPATFEFLLFQC